MNAFQDYYADVRDPAQQPRVRAQLRERGLVTFSGIVDRATLVTLAQRLMVIRPHRDAGPDGVTVITDTKASSAGYAAFTNAEMIPHTDGSSLPDPPALLLLACQEPAREGGQTVIVDGARIIETLAERHPSSIRSLAATATAFFGAGGGYLGPVFASAGPGRMSIRLRLDELAWFCADAAAAIPPLRAAIRQHQQILRLSVGEGLLLSNARWLHGRTRYTGRRIMLRILGDALPSADVRPGFPCSGPLSAAATALTRAAAIRWRSFPGIETSPEVFRLPGGGGGLAHGELGG